MTVRFDGVDDWVDGVHVSTIRRHNGKYETIIFDGPQTEEGNPVYPWPGEDAATEGHAAILAALIADPLTVPALPPTEEGQL